uniref:Autophagy-related protein 11 C-terminal domain-containing protein n=1 Tax=Panagrolaimus sp. JU765 TaxID=591449 RepID=A0AC34RPI1_9BILA
MSFRSQHNFVSRTASSTSMEPTYSVFYVNQGYMLGIRAAKDATVEELQNSICDKISIPRKEQMVFLQGGIVPPPDTNLSDEDIATETKPLFLFRRTSNDDSNSSSEEFEGLKQMMEQYANDVDPLIEKKDFGNSALKLFTKRTTDIINLIVRLARKVVQDHGHLNTAWLAMASFLDKRIDKLSQRRSKFDSKIQKMEMARKDGQIILNDFGEVFETLKRIILPYELVNANNTESTIEHNEISLYDWIKSKDPVYHLDDLVLHAKEALENFDNVSVRNAAQILENDRLKSLKVKLALLTDRGKGLMNIANETLHNYEYLMKNPSSLENVREGVQKMYDETRILIKSKAELLGVLKQKTEKTFLQVHDFLAKADREMIVFEEQARHLGDQLKLLNQIRETPILYVTAVAEVIRRAALQKEFSSWFSMHVEKCTEFLNDENKIRNEFNSKLEKHFLRQLFHGMSEKMPVFHPQIPPFDTRLPRITHQYLHQLRNDLKDMSNLLNVTVPNVFNRLSVFDKNVPISIDTSHNPLRREESFFTHEKTSNMETINRNFPSTNYLSGFDTECSPGSIQKFGQGFSSQMSLNFSESAVGTPYELKPLTFDLGAKEDDTPRTSYYTKSDPISIPVRGSNPLSETSSQFNTPDDVFSSPDKFINHQQQIAEEHGGKQLKEETTAVLKDVKLMISSCKKEIEEVRNIFEENEEDFKKQFKPEIFNVIVQKLQEEMDLRRDEHLKIIEEVREENEELLKTLEIEKNLRHDKEKELESCNDALLRQNDELSAIIKAKDDLQVDILRLETEKKKLEQQLQADSCTDYLEVELKIIADVLKRPLSDEEIERIKSEIEHRRRVLSPTPSEQSDRGTRNSQADYENALRKKMQLIIQGIENKKDSEIAKMREEMQSNFVVDKSQYEDEMNKKIHDLEQKIASYQNSNLTSIYAPSLNDQAGQSSVENLLARNMQESCMVVNTSALSNRDYDNRNEDDEEEVAVGGEDEVAEINTIGTQTRIRMKEMSMMISLQDIHEGCSVLVMWDNSHNSYMVFSTSRTLHFVRESCMKRFCPDPQTSARRNWMFAVVTHIDYCQIRKESNRYNMPLGTRFYRVEVKPLAIEQSSTAPSRRS